MIMIGKPLIWILRRAAKKHSTEHEEAAKTMASAAKIKKDNSHQ